ncbi:hypothetical protein H920_15337 [Fukomys damarensis]|uniref:Uncharacterized protein n=1 Tax=Fukomys damarensis TaxID=885580 RepID=A0A091CWV7_FUKDA|nr:hypothetical protein H920_15337 [Fukomys damarensis]
MRWLRDVLELRCCGPRQPGESKPGERALWGHRAARRHTLAPRLPGATAVQLKDILKAPCPLCIGVVAGHGGREESGTSVHSEEVLELGAARFWSRCRAPDTKLCCPPGPALPHTQVEVPLLCGSPCHTVVVMTCVAWGPGDLAALSTCAVGPGVSRAQTVCRALTVL